MVKLYEGKIKSIIRILLIVTGIALIIDGLVFTVLSNFSTGIILVLMLGGFSAACGIWFDDIRHITEHGIWRIVKYITAALIIFTLGMCIFIGIYGNTDTISGDEDVIMVLGCGVKGTVPTAPLAARLEAAAEALSENENAYVILSGGKGPQEDISEADAMEKYLLERDIEPSKIIKEDKSTSTSENYKYSKKLLDSRFSNYKIAVITNDFHIYRAKNIAKMQGLDITTKHAKTQLSAAPMMYLREVLAILKLWILKY